MFCDAIVKEDGSLNEERILAKIDFCNMIQSSWKDNLPKDYINFDKGVNYLYANN